MVFFGFVVAIFFLTFGQTRDSRKYGENGPHTHLWATPFTACLEKALLSCRYEKGVGGARNRREMAKGCLAFAMGQKGGKRLACRGICSTMAHVVFLWAFGMEKKKSLNMWDTTGESAIINHH